jgi:acetyl esterase/lipase
MIDRTCWLRQFWQSMPLAIFCGLMMMPAAAKSAEPAEITNGVVYGNVGGIELKLDVASPREGKGPFPAILFIHGGGWSSGDRSVHHREIRNAVEKGYVAASASYRLTEPDQYGKPRNTFPAQINDVKCAVRFLRANAKRYHIDPDRIGAAGGSAGGHLSLLLGVTDRSHDLEGDGGSADFSSRVQAVVNYYGPTDLIEAHKTGIEARKYFEALLDGTPETAADLYRKASPVMYVTEDDPPILTLHGQNDKLIPFTQAQLFDRAAHRAGAWHQLQMVPDQGHGFQGEAADQAYRSMFQFFDDHLKPAGSQSSLVKSSEQPAVE